MANRPAERINATTPPAILVQSKTVQIARTDTTAFEAFTLPKGCVYVGSYVMGTVASDAATTATIDLGTVPGTTNEVVAAYSVKTSGVGYVNMAGRQVLELVSNLLQIL